MVGSLVDRLPDAVLLLIIAHVCAIAPPQTPGICWVTPVCKRWRQLAAHVKGLRVLFQGQRYATINSFEAWISRHAAQVTALASFSRWHAPLGALRQLAQAAANAAAAGQPLPLQRLVLRNGYTLEDPDWCRHILGGLFSALPQLQHLHLQLWAPDDVEWVDDRGHKAAVATLAPLRHLTSLTSLHLDGPHDPGELGCDYEGWDADLLACLPSSLARLEWHEAHEGDIDALECDRLTGLTELHLLTTSGQLEPELVNYTGLPQLQKLKLYGFNIGDHWLLQHKEVLQGWGVDSEDQGVPECLGQLVNLKTLDLRGYLLPAVIQAALVAATQVTQLHLALKHEDHDAAAAAAAAAPDGCLAARAWLPPVLAMTGLRALTLEVPSSCSFLPVGMGGLSQLTRLHTSFSPTTPGITCAWVCAIERLVNLQVLTVPAVTMACSHRWLTGLTKLGVLELFECSLPDEHSFWPKIVAYDLEAAAGHLQCLVSAAAGGGRGTGGPVAAAAVVAAAAAATGCSLSKRSSDRLQLVCVDSRGLTDCGLDDAHRPLYRRLRQGLQGNVALFSGSLGSFLACGWQLWPQPTARRLQQLLGDIA